MAIRPDIGTSSMASLKERLDKMSVLLDVAKVMSSERDLDRLLVYIAEQVTYVTDSDRCSIFLLDPKTDELWSKVALKESKEIRVPRTAGIVGYATTTGETVNIPNVYEDPRFNKEVDIATGYRTRNLICLPLKNVAGSIVGALQVLNKKDGPFTDADREFLTIFCSQAAVAIESAQLYREKEKALLEVYRKVRQLDILYNVEKEINASETYDRFMGGVLSKATEAVGVQGLSILKPAGAEGRLKFDYVHGDGSDALRGLLLSPGEGIASWVFQHGESVVANDIARDTRHSSRFEEITGIRVQNLMGLPLRNREGVTGVLEFVNRTDGEFTPEDLRIAEMLATQISTAVDRFMLLQEKQRSERLATVGQMAGSIIHDFKNPMAIIRGMGELLQKDRLPEDKRTRFANIIIGEVDRCVTMTRELLEYCRGEKNYNFKEVDFARFMEDIILILEQDFSGTGIALECRVDYEGPVRLDEDKLRRVIFNLSNNARSVMKDSGGVFSVDLCQDGQQILLKVADTGPGIPVEIRDKLFDPFVTLGKKHGTGLGLAIVKEIIAGHGGEISVVDEPGKGAVFAIRLPLP